MEYQIRDIVVVRHYYNSYIGVITNKHPLSNYYVNRKDQKYEIIAYKCTKCSESIITMKKIPYIDYSFLTLFDISCLSINPKLHNVLLVQSTLLKLKRKLKL